MTGRTHGLEPNRPSRVSVLFVTIQMTGMGGSERLVLDLVRNLDRRVFSPSVAWFIGEEPLAELKALQVPLYYVPKRKPFDWRAMTRLAEIVRSQRIDVVNAHHFMSFVYAFYAARVVGNARLFYTEHSEQDVLQVAGKWQVLGRALLPSCGAVGISERVSETLCHHFHLTRRNVHTIPNGVDLALFGDTGRDRGAVRARLGVSPEEILIGHVANFKKNKNHLFLLKAFRRLARERGNVRLALIGRGFAADADNSEAEVAAYIRQNGLTARVLVLGYRPDVHEILAGIDIFSLVSEREGLPLSLLEAMASGLPLIGTRVEGIQDVIEQDVNGFLVTPDDVDGLTRTLAGLADDAELRRRMGRASRRIAQQKYSLSRCIDETQQLFLADLDRRARSSRPEPVVL